MDPAADRAQVADGLLNCRVLAPAFGDQPGDGLFMPRDHNLFTSRDALEKFAESGFCFKRRDRRHFLIHQNDYSLAIFTMGAARRTRPRRLPSTVSASG
jgi:hypothetical protein